jgi:glycosyltransferase involved in cell wall biosynthesis
VVVDNGSTDETAEVIASFANRLPLHSVLEPRVGKNSALNTGLGLIEGDLTVLTDDDVFPRTDWLVQLRSAADAHQECAMFGGAVVPRWESAPPTWLEWIDLGPIFTITPAHMQDGTLPPEQVTWIQGPNMAVRASVFRTGARFNPSIGPSGSSYPMGSETELLLRLCRKGYKAWHVQDAIVEHFVRTEQLNQSWILQRAIRYGRGWHRMAPNERLWLGVPRHLFRDIPKQGVLIAVAWVQFRRDTVLRARWRFNYLLGIAIESLIMDRERRIQKQVTSPMSTPRRETEERARG